MSTLSITLFIIAVIVGFVWVSWWLHQGIDDGKTYLERLLGGGSSDCHGGGGD